MIRGCSSAGRAPALQAGGRRFDPVQLHHHVLVLRRKGADHQEKETSLRTVMVCVFCMKIVKRRYVRIFLEEYVARDAHYPLHHDWQPNRAIGQISRSWSFLSIPSRASPGWILAMRTIKCLKGIWWMPWHAQAMKDVIRCDKPWGAANKL